MDPRYNRQKANGSSIFGGYSCWEMEKTPKPTEKEKKPEGEEEVVVLTEAAEVSGNTAILNN